MQPTDRARKHPSLKPSRTPSTSAGGATTSATLSESRQSASSLAVGPRRDDILVRSDARTSDAQANRNEPNAEDDRGSAANEGILRIARSEAARLTKPPKLDLSALTKPEANDEMYLRSPVLPVDSAGAHGIGTPPQKTVEQRPPAETARFAPPNPAPTTTTPQKTEGETVRHRPTTAPRTKDRPNKAAGAALSVLRQPKTIRFSWIVARGLIKLQMQAAETFHLNGVPWSLWQLQKIPTLGASPTSCRVQEMYKASVPSLVTGGPEAQVFVKSIPISIWRKQWDRQNKWNGEYVTDGENFVMEAAALAFLQQYGPDLSPRLLGILRLCNGAIPQGKGAGSREVTHIIILSELYGEDLLDFLERREREKLPLTDSEKKRLQLDCLTLLKRLHTLGLAHLDFTPENVLYGKQGLRLCDFAKATPISSNCLRHVKAEGSCSPPFPFESCEPTVGKGAYMPPECWLVYWRLENSRVQYPLDELWSLVKSSERERYYFRVDRADIYMAGVLMFWLWSEGGIWKCSDTKQDEKYNHLVRSGLNFDLFRECRSWPSRLKEMLQAVLTPDPELRLSLDEALQHPWFDSYGNAETIKETWQSKAQPKCRNQKWESDAVAEAVIGAGRTATGGAEAQNSSIEGLPQMRPF